MLVLQLPNELLSSVAEYIADTFTVTEPSPYCHFQPVPSDLISLSLVSSRWRRICLPFLFARVKFTARKIKKFKIFCSRNPLSSSLIRSIHPHRFPVHRAEEHLLCQTLPYLIRLTSMDLSEMTPTSTLLHAILEKSTVATVLMSRFRLPAKPLRFDMSKLVLRQVVLTQQDRCPELDEHLRRGLKVAKVELYGFDMLEGIAALPSFQGLEEIVFKRFKSASCQGLPDLTSTHPRLRKLWLINEGLSANLSPSFIQSFSNEALSQDLSKHFRITKIGLSRHSCHVWCITSLTLVTTFASHSLIGILSLVASHFPAIEDLALDLDGHKYAYSLDDLVAALRPFYCLRTLHLISVFRRLKLEDKRWSPLRPLTKNTSTERLAVNAEAGLTWFISQLAKELVPLEAFYVLEDGPQLYLKGWLYVKNGIREVDGKLKLELPGLD
ncbi:hypothetical protein D9757_003222 [Collybiopsis confluens]|uniref:F-box domain-containing protein n=1 Tax=Collybiopsis confluens TaxID=2823264 RepID=A0A8H5MF34_9AGAR|nr:hypothetical protein D9757_003222 [Collybiopsis confluens]